MNNCSSAGDKITPNPLFRNLTDILKPLCNGLGLALGMIVLACVVFEHQEI